MSPQLEIKKKQNKKPKKLFWLVPTHSISLSLAETTIIGTQVRLISVRKKKPAVLASVLELSFLDTTGMWCYHFKSPVPTLGVTIMSLFHLTSYLIRPVGLVLLTPITLSPALPMYVAVSWWL